jgi:PAS domain S-box-containing protein
MRILHLEDNPGDAELIRGILTAEWPECEIRQVSSRFAFTGEMRLGTFDVVLSDFTMPAYSGMEALKLVREVAPDTPFIFLSGTIGEDRAIEALQAGAQDYVLKDRMKRLVAAIHRVLRESAGRRERLRAERLIREQAELLNHAREAIVITDLDGRILYWNAGAERLYGWSPGEVRGRTAAQLFTNRDELATLEAAWGTTVAKGAWRGELHLHGRDGAALMVEMRQTLICDEAGKPKARLSLSSDITEWKRLEEQLIRAQRLENIGLLAAGIAHDLNNMLAPIVMAMPLLRDAIADATGNRVLDTVEASALRGVDLVRQILSFAKGANSELELVHVKHLLRELELFIAATFPRNIRLDCQIPPDLWPIKASATQVHQVLLNLCVNARDAMPEGGTLRLCAANRLLDEPTALAIDGGRPGAFLALTVADTGTGIAPEVLARMWEPFVTTKGAANGTGLGLSTVRGIVRNHGGYVQLQTQAGKGTAFTVFLPAAAGAGAPDLPVAPADAVRGHGDLILIVDDEESIRAMIATVLTRYGYRTMVAADGAEALTLFAAHLGEIRLVVCDIRMPKIDGPTMAGLLQRIDPAIKMLFVSGLGSAGSVTFGRDASGNLAAPLLKKPFMPRDLLDKVHEMLATPPMSANN